MYAGTVGYWVYTSIDNGENWQLVKSGMGEDKYVLSLLTNSTGYLFAGMDYYGLYKSVNKVVTDVEDINEIPMEFSLEQNFPNPFNPSTKIRFAIPTVETHRDASLLTTLRVYDILGNEVAPLVNEYRSAGSYEVEFQSSVGGHQLANGVYFYSLRADNYIQTKKMILLK